MRTWIRKTPPRRRRGRRRRPRPSPPPTPAPRARARRTTPRGRSSRADGSISISIGISFSQRKETNGVPLHLRRIDREGRAEHEAGRGKGSGSCFFQHLHLRSFSYYEFFPGKKGEEEGQRKSLNLIFVFSCFFSFYFSMIPEQRGHRTGGGWIPDGSFSAGWLGEDHRKELALGREGTGIGKWLIRFFRFAVMDAFVVDGVEFFFTSFSLGILILVLSYLSNIFHGSALVLASFVGDEGCSECWFLWGRERRTAVVREVDWGTL